MKISDTVPSSTFFMPSSLLLKTNKPMKPFKFNRRLKNRMNSLSKSLAPMSIPINNYQIVPASSLWTDSKMNPSNPLVTLASTNHNWIHSSPLSIATPMNNQEQSQQDAPSNLIYKSFIMPRVTTTLIPLSQCPTEYSQTVKPIPLSSVNILNQDNEQNRSEGKSKATVLTHLIGDWIIRESSEPFQRNENERSTPIERTIHQEKNNVSDKDSLVPKSYQSLNVNQWTTDDVCLFFANILGKNTYASIIKEHLIDGAALLLLQDEHLTDIFKMQLGPRLKLLNRINQLKKGDFSGL